MKNYYVYILASKYRGTLYVGVTSDLFRRLEAHKEKIQDGFTKTYDVTRLVYFEVTDQVMGALQREKQLKWWKRAWKIELIEKDNPLWGDLLLKLQ